tara:strand:- start:7220 stop:7648 length:429 start_codon:yes stop_codon:yes gene_type:complete
VAVLLDYALNLSKFIYDVQMTKISLTPVIDVVFILLIFFMLASNFNKVGEISMDIAKESTKASQEDIKILKVMVHQDSTVMLDNKTYSDNELLTTIQIAIKDSSQYSIILTSRNDVTYQRFLSVMSFLKSNKISNIKIGIKK